MTLFESPTDRTMGQGHVISSPLDALAPWLEVIDMIVQRYFAAQQARGDDRFNIESIMIPMDVLESAAYVPRGRPKWLDACASESNPTDVLPPLPELLAGVVQRFGLREFDVLAILLGMMPVLEPRYGALLAYIQGDEQALWPHIDLILSLFSAPGDRVQHRMRLTAADQPLRYGGLIHLSERSGRTSSREDVLYICTASSVVGYLSTGVVPLSQKMVDVGQWLTPMAPNVLELSAEWRRFGTDLQQFCFGQASATTPVVLLEGGEGGDKMLAHVAAEAGRQAFLVDLQSLPEEANEAWPVLLEALHVTRLSAGLLVFKNFTSFEQAHPKLLRALDVRLRTHGEPVVVLLAADANGSGLRELPRLKMTLPRQSAQDDIAAIGVALLQCAEGLPATSSPDDLPQLLKRTRVDLDTLNYAVHEAHWYAQQRAPSAALDGQDIYRALRSRALQQFGPLAQRLEPRRGLSDLVISEGLREQMDEILAAISHRDDVLNRGFAKKISYGVGVSALFYGDSGTGKTMAAEALAFELGLDLIRVDLSTVVNKYVGETEKNLSKIFDLALADTGVLLFDEADALFGKRSEVTSAHDRHANIEVSYLLQRLEHYPGLVVLSTNNRAHLDGAFTRRLTFMARFESPDVALRTQMWEQIWPAGVDRSAGIEWADLAKRAELTGAGIRNVALLASWLAARAQRPVDMVDIERAMRRELGKTGRLMSRT
ncbi:hypothetical protein ACVWZP_001077 [Pseudomonas sp. TE36184]